MTEQKKLGDWGEGQAAAYLERRGYTVLARNWHCRYGELDIVAANGTYLAFVEVKTRKDSRFMAAREAVDFRKQQRIVRAAEQWLLEHPEEERQVRFDVAEVYSEGRSGRPRLCYLENAFQEQ